MRSLVAYAFASQKRTYVPAVAPIPPVGTPRPTAPRGGGGPQWPVGALFPRPRRGKRVRKPVTYAFASQKRTYVRGGAPFPR